MSKIEQLPEITSRVLSGLKADETLKYRIIASAAEGTVRRSFSRVSIGALCCLSAAMIALCILISPHSSSDHSAVPGLHETAAGTHRSSSPVHLQQLLSRETDQEKDKEINSESFIDDSEDDQDQLEEDTYRKQNPSE